MRKNRQKLVFFETLQFFLQKSTARFLVGASIQPKKSNKANKKSGPKTNVFQSIKPT
jgi:hypothetical protein